MHLRDCLIDAQTGNQVERGQGIRQEIDHERSVRMWYLTQRTGKEPGRQAVLKVQTMNDGKTSTYQKQPDTERVIQKYCDCQFTLAHMAPITKHMLATHYVALLTKKMQNP